jgi:hypothetical protein
LLRKYECERILSGVLKGRTISIEPRKTSGYLVEAIKLVLSTIKNPLHVVDRTSHRQLRGWFLARDPLYAVAINNPTRLASKPQQPSFFTVGGMLV